MPLYEVTCIMRSELNKEEKDKIIEEIKNFNDKDMGEIKNIEEIGVKKFAHEINKMAEGFFITFYLQIDSSQIEKFHKFLISREEIKRLMIIRRKNGFLEKKE